MTGRHRPGRAAAAAVLATAGLLALPTNALAQPSVPATYYGSASIDGRPVPDGTDVRGYVGGKDCTQTGLGLRGTVQDGGASAYVITVMHDSQEPGCGRAGATVTFTVGGQPAGQQTTWKPGPERVDLNAGAGSPVPLPTPTPAPRTPTAVPTTAGADATVSGQGAAPAESATPSAPAGTPPRDDIPLPFPSRSRTAVPPTAPAGGPPAEAGGGGDGGGWMLLAGGAGIAVAGGAVAGMVIARRRQRQG